MNFPSLFSPGTIGGCSLKNRIIMPLYPTKYATDSRVNGKMLEFYRARVRGGVGLIVLDCPCLDYPRAYKGPHELRIDRPEYSDTVVELLKAVHDEGARAFMQLNYPKERAFDHEVPVVAIAKINTPNWPRRSSVRAGRFRGHGQAAGCRSGTAQQGDGRPPGGNQGLRLLSGGLCG